MQHLDIFQPGALKLSGNARIQDEPIMLSGRAVLLSTPGDALSLEVRGHQLGIIFFRHDWSGVVEIQIDQQVQQIDLYAERGHGWLFEAPLPSGAARLSVRLLNQRNPRSHAQQVWVQSVYIADEPTSAVPDLIAQRVVESPFEAASLNQLTDVFKWYDREWMAAQAALAACPSYTPPDYVHRKTWEWTQCIYGLDKLGMFNPDYSALGVGVGWEPISFFFANHFSSVVATDLYSVDDEWTGREGNPQILENPDDFAPFPYRRDRVRFLRMDGKQLDFPDESFDVIWSCSSIEHFGRHVGAAQAMREIQRVLKPGGIVVMITEYVLPDQRTGQHNQFDVEYFNLRCVYEYLLRPVPQLRLVQRLDLSIPDYYVRRACKLPEEARAPHDGINKPHIVLLSPNGAYHTSIAMFLRKDGPPRQPAPPRFING